MWVEDWESGGQEEDLGGTGWGGIWETESDEWIPPCTPSLPPCLPQFTLLLRFFSHLCCSAKQGLWFTLVHIGTFVHIGTLQIIKSATQRTLEQGPNFGSSTLSSGVSRPPAARTKATHL